METWIENPKSQAALCSKSLKSLFKNSPTAMLVAGKDESIKDANASACRLLGTTRNELIGQSSTKWLPFNRTAPTSTDGVTSPVVIEQNCLPPIKASIHSTPIQTGSETASLISFWLEDDGMQNHEANTQQPGASLRDTKSASRHIANVITDSLTPIQGFVSLAQEDLQNGQMRRAHLDQIASAADRGAQFARDLFAYSSHSPQPPAIYSPAELLTELQEELATIAGESTIISYSISTDAPFIKIHREDFRTIIRHAIGNASAIANSDKHTRRIIEVRCAPGTLSKDIDSNFEPSTSSSIITITDNAPALDSEICARVFDPFYSLPQRQDPHGLRLPTINQLMRNHYGSADFCPLPGKGNTLELVFAQSRH